jgi:predicted RNase H-like HicB family nuclease
LAGFIFVGRPWPPSTLAYCGRIKNRTNICFTSPYVRNLLDETNHWTSAKAMNYACKIKPDTKGYHVQFRDIPEALTGGDTVKVALHHAHDALLTALEFYFNDGRLVPTPSAKKRGEHMVTVPALVAAKIELHNDMVASTG